MEAILFYSFGALAVVCALMMILSRKAVTSAMALIVVMFALAGLFAMEEAHLIAALQVLVYAGAIMVLFIFVIMLLNLREKGGMLTGRQPLIQVAAVALATVGIVPMVAGYDAAGVAGRAAEAVEGFGTVAGVGTLLYTDFILPFEIASVLLLGALVGAVILTKAKLR